MCFPCCPVVPTITKKEILKNISGLFALEIMSQMSPGPKFLGEDLNVIHDWSLHWQLNLALDKTMDPKHSYVLQESEIQRCKESTRCKFDENPPTNGPTKSRRTAHLRERAKSSKPRRDVQKDQKRAKITMY
uniref:Uncharacterized protein n=1 Tax=Romanomermis culicivorax TaxID=13658 RepID=A0A915IDG3_ROMCU